MELGQISLRAFLDWIFWDSREQWNKLILHILNEFLFNLSTQIHPPQKSYNCLFSLNSVLVTGKVTLALWTCFLVCIMGMENTEKHYRVRQKQKAYVADLHGPQSPRRWYPINNTNLFGHNPHMQRAELSTFRCGCQFQPAHVLAVWALISTSLEKVKHLAHTVPHLITSLKPCKIALITPQEMGSGPCSSQGEW